LTGPIVLVGHSYGGNVISVAAAGNAQVTALVYLNGWMCDEGESQQQLLEKFEGSLVGPSIRPVPFTAPDGSEGPTSTSTARRSTKPSPPTSTRRPPR
jgi:pimeloyl-ACP methyl ester carboxylesterase